MFGWHEAAGVAVRQHDAINHHRIRKLTMTQDWGDLLVTLMHDPPDKALDIRGHESRAARYASVALGREVDSQELRTAKSTADELASIAERIPMPTAGVSAERAVGVEDGHVEVVHPLSGQQIPVAVSSIRESLVADTLRKITATARDDRARYASVWRWLPESLCAASHQFAYLPADSRCPDHTIWQHLDITAGLKTALGGRGGAALLAFALGPVQPFIAAARSTRDLWSGSMILSWLAFRAMQPVIGQYGPTSMVFPALRGSSLADLWLCREFGMGGEPPTESSKLSPSLPHRFLAVVPWDDAGRTASELAAECERQAATAWSELSGAVRLAIQVVMREVAPGWDDRWDEQIAGYFDFRAVAIPLRGCDDKVVTDLNGGKSYADVYPEAAFVRALAERIPTADRPGYAQDGSGRWQAQVELVGRLLATKRVYREPPRGAVCDTRYAPKCSLFGFFEQMGPAERSAADMFWAEFRKRVSLHGVRLRSRERFGAIALVKRFVGPAFFAQELGISPQRLRFPDTATVAASTWLKRAKIDPNQVRSQRGDWSGQWLHWRSRTAETDEARVPEDTWNEISAACAVGRPPSYYAVLKLDGDELGRWLQGEKSPRVSAILHPKLRQYFEQCGATNDELSARRPVGPALHAAVSQALANFSQRSAPQIIREHDGTLIFAGGDDVLAIVPLETSLACAMALRTAYRGDGQDDSVPPGYVLHNNQPMLTMGPTATCSAGVAIVHYKEDLRFALEAARQAEHAAKQYGRNALVLNVCRRSGEHALSLCPWEFVAEMQWLVQAFRQGATDRWAYRLREHLHVMEALPPEAFQTEVRRQVDRSELETRVSLGESSGRSAGEAMAERFVRFRQLTVTRGLSDAEIIRQFTLLMQSASFLARGRDE